MGKLPHKGGKAGCGALDVLQCLVDLEHVSELLGALKSELVAGNTASKCAVWRQRVLTLCREATTKKVKCVGQAMVNSLD